ncbi:hypothetical protein, partial [Bacteroides cellulosilyticus]|uniref:hypothetical protein n=1 Tax=Bacteroides cellulosilyticus TaxID=246787 RepID=UPI0034A4C547
GIFLNGTPIINHFFKVKKQGYLMILWGKLSESSSHAFLNLLCHHGLAGRFSLFSPLDIANIPRSFPFHFPLEAI